MTTFLGVPVLVAGEPYGNLYLTEKQGGEPFTDADEEAVVLLADFAGVAIDHARRFTRSETRRVDLQHTVDALDASMQISRALGGETDVERDPAAGREASSGVGVGTNGADRAPSRRAPRCRGRGRGASP